MADNSNLYTNRLVFKFLYMAYEKVLFEQKNIKLWNKCHCRNENIDYAACLKMQQIFLLPTHMKWILGFFFHVCSYMKTQVFLKVQIKLDGAYSDHCAWKG